MKILLGRTDRSSRRPATLMAQLFGARLAEKCVFDGCRNAYCVHRSAAYTFVSRVRSAVSPEASHVWYNKVILRRNSAALREAVTTIKVEQAYVRTFQMVYDQTGERC